MLSLVVALVAVWAAPAHATFHGRNGLIAFDGTVQGASCGTHCPVDTFYVTDARGRHIRRLRVPTAGLSLSFAPVQPAFLAAFPVSGGKSWQIGSVALRNGSQKRLVSGDQLADPAWAPDGKRFAYIAGGDKLVIGSRGGSRARAITSAVAEPAWSARGLIAFERQRQSASGFATSLIYTVRASGSGLRQITQGAFDDEYPSWSPDGRMLAFTRYPVAGDMFGDPSVAVAQADGSNIRIVRAGAARPVWSPDGRWIAFQNFTSGETNPGDLYLMHPDGTQVTPLVRALALHQNGGLAPLDWQALR